jgi:hypothetical protein
MKLEPTLDIIPSILFPFDINSDQDETIENLIAKTDINNDDELTHLFNTLIKPEFTKRIISEQQWYIDTLTFFLNKNEKFNRVFSEITTYFSEEPIDKRHFMSVLLECLKKYKTS